MQEVYRAHDDMLKRMVALKVPQDARVARKFRQSAILSARVNHPNVAKTLDYFEDDERFYMVEEFIDGLDLKHVLARFKRSDPHTAAHILHHLARGLAASHRAGVVHRDLKPSNIMVVGGLEFKGLKVTDFGIAKMAEHEVQQAVSGGEETTRSSRTVMNALAYVAPEVVDAPRTVSRASDVWAIAAIAWEVLTGSPPFGTGLQALRNLFSAPPPQLPPDITNHSQFGPLSRELGETILFCFEKDPALRITAEELSQRCDLLCYLPPVRELGVISNYQASTFGFIRADRGSDVFFHTQNVITDDGRPEPGTRVWFTRFDGQPRDRAIPVVPLLPDPQSSAT
jgi:serine/threonine-protein kinase